MFYKLKKVFTPFNCFFKQQKHVKNLGVFICSVATEKSPVFNINMPDLGQQCYFALPYPVWYLWAWFGPWVWGIFVSLETGIRQQHCTYGSTGREPSWSYAPLSSWFPSHHPPLALGVVHSPSLVSHKGCVG